MLTTEQRDMINSLVNAVMLSMHSSAIRNDKCFPKPIGCGLPVTGFDNALSAKEYTISGLCQNCQNEVFGKSGD